MISEWGRRPHRRRLGGFGILIAAVAAFAASAAGVSPTEEPATLAPLGAQPQAAPALAASAEAQADTPAVATPDQVVTAENPVIPAPVASTPPPAPPTPVGEAPRADDVPDEWIVELKPGQSSDTVADQHAAGEGADVHYVYSDAVDGYAATMTDAEAASVADDPRVASVTRDRMVYAAAQSLPTGVKRIGAPTTGVGVTADVDVAVVDTGIAAHPDLNVAGGKNCNGTETSYNDTHGHGTHVAGTIGARNDTNGVVGVVPGARLWAVRVLGANGSGTWSQIICGLDWVRAQGNIEVVNMSLGGSGTEGTNCASSTYRAAICNLKAAGVTVVVAAGNESSDANGKVPATYPEVITVSALVDTDGAPGGLGAASCGSYDDTFANFSNYGPDIDVIAPGGCIYSTHLGGGYGSMSGTSMAAPHVAGVAALYKIANPAATPDDIRSYLISTGSSNWNATSDRDTIKEPLVQAVAAPVAVPETPPSPNFTSSCSNLACTFTDTSATTNGDAITAWAWNFGAGQGTSTTRHPSYTFTAAGTYTVQLTATDNDGSASVSKQVTVSLPPPPPPETPPSPNFTSSCSGLTCTFTDTSATTNGDAITAWAWSFGAGQGTSTTRNPSYTFTAAGTYTVQLTATDNDGSASVSKQVTVSVPPPPPPSSIALTLSRPWATSSWIQLQWSGAAGTNVEIWRKATGAATFSLVATIGNDGHEFHFPGAGTWDFKLCQVGGTVCSPVRTITA